MLIRPCCRAMNEQWQGHFFISYVQWNNQSCWMFKLITKLWISWFKHTIKYISKMKINSWKVDHYNQMYTNQEGTAIWTDSRHQASTIRRFHSRRLCTNNKTTIQLNNYINSKLHSLPRLFPISLDCLPGFWFLLFSFYALSNDT